MKKMGDPGRKKHLREVLPWALPLAAALGLAILLGYFLSVDNIAVFGGWSEVAASTIEADRVEEIPAADTPCGVVSRFHLTVDPVSRERNRIAFYVYHQYVRVWLDGELIYSLSPSGENAVGRTLGSNWAVLPLTAGDGGKELLVELTPVYQSSRGQIPEFLFGSALSIYRDQLKKDLPQIVLSAIAIIVGLVFVGSAVHRMARKKRGKGVLNLGLFAVMLGIWRLTDIRFSSFLSPNRPIFLFYLSVSMLMLCMIPLLRFVGEESRAQWAVDGFSIAAPAVCLLQLLLQVLGVFDFREMLFVTHGMCALCVVCVGIVMVSGRKERGGTLSKRIRFWAPLICVAGMSADAVTYYVSASSSSLLFSLTAVLIYVIYTGFSTLLEYREQEKRLLTQERELVEARISVMLSQIQPHFLYNTLGTIAELCREEPEKARSVTLDFAEYLRVNLKAMQQKSLVSIKDEMTHVQRYLMLEKTRFGEYLNIHYDLQPTVFYLPQLSVQPLVENAVKHGVGRRETPGNITVRTWEDDRGWYVSVEDDGVGFDPRAVSGDGKVHLGIENVRSRLDHLCGGTLEITSRVGVGTTALICVPKDEDA